MVKTCVLQTLDNAEISVLQLDIFSDQTDTNGRGGRFDPGDNLAPWRQIDFGLEAQHITNSSV